MSLCGVWMALHLAACLSAHESWHILNHQPKDRSSWLHGVYTTQERRIWHAIVLKGTFFATSRVYNDSAES